MSIVATAHWLNRYDKRFRMLMSITKHLQPFRGKPF
jgi:hypothetical protein